MKSSEPAQFKHHGLRKQDAFITLPQHLVRGPVALGLSCPLTAHLLLFLNALPPGAPISTPLLVEEFGICRNTCGKSIRELEEKGYVHRRRSQAVGGKFETIIWQIFDEPTFGEDVEMDEETTAQEMVSGDQDLCTTAQNMRSGAQNMTPLTTECAVVNSSPNNSVNQGVKLIGEPAKNSGQSVGDSIITTTLLPVSSSTTVVKEKEKESPKKTSRNFTEVGSQMADAYAKWRLETHGSDYAPAKASDGAVASFNSMGKILMTRYKFEVAKAAACFSKILLRSKELDRYYTGQMFSPTRLEKEFLAIVALLEKQKPLAAAPAAPAPTPSGLNERGVFFRLKRLNKWAAYWKLPEIKELGGDDYDQHLHDSLLDVYPEDIHPRNTRFAQQWQAIHQPVNA